MLKSHLSIRHDGDEEETKHPEEEEEAEPDILEEHIKHLKKSQVSIRLSLVGRTAEGHGYTYLKATITDLGLTHIGVIKYFKHLQFVDVSSNCLELEQLQVVTELPNLVLLHADKNKITSGALRRMKYFQVLIVNYNSLESVHDIYQPELTTLEIGFNKVEKIHFDSRMPHIRCLDFRNNLVRDLVGIDFPMLDSLYLANNRITSLVGIEVLLNLRILHVRHNPIKVLDGFSEDQTKLQYVNLRNCKVGTRRQVRKLRVLSGLETLILKGCPYMGGTGEEDAERDDTEDDAEIRLETLATIFRLKRLNKEPVTPDERSEAKALMQQWRDEGDRDEEEIEHEEVLAEGEEIIEDI